MNTWCPECGPDVPVDEDGCCAMCGATATGRGADLAHELREAAMRRLDIIRSYADSYEIGSAFVSSGMLEELGRAAAERDRTVTIEPKVDHEP